MRTAFTLRKQSCLDVLIIRQQPDPTNKLVFKVGSLLVTSCIDVAAWDCSQILPELVMFGSVEAKSSPGKWNYPQFMGQLLSQAALNYTAGRIEKDGSVGCSI
jgi:hypothetical protein